MAEYFLIKTTSTKKKESQKILRTSLKDPKENKFIIPEFFYQMKILLKNDEVRPWKTERKVEGAYFNP